VHIDNLPIGWMSVAVFGLVYLATAIIFAAAFRLAGGKRTPMFKGVSPGMLPPVGIIFGLFVAFVASQVWSDTDRARAAVNTEANSLSTVIFLAASFPGEPELRMRELTRRHIAEVVTVEWPLMAQHDASSFMVTPAALAEELQFVLALKPQSEGQITAQRQIVAALEGAMEARRQRIAVSRSRVNWVKWTALILQAICTLIAIVIVHIDNRAAAAISLWIFATGIAVSILLVASHDRPFSGQLSVKPDLLKQVLPEEAVTQGAINHTILVHLTSLLRAARQVISDDEDAMAAGKFLSGKELVERAKAKYAEQTGRALPNLDPASPEGRMLQAEMEAIQEVMDESQFSGLRSHGNFKGVIPAVFTYQVAQRFTGKVGEFAYVKLTAPPELIRHQPNTPDAWEKNVIQDKFQSPGWNKGEFVEEVAELNGKKAYRVIIPEYYEPSCLACHGEPKGSVDITGGKKEGGKLGDLGGAISAAIYLK
jgi:hypothetical protein